MVFFKSQSLNFISDRVIASESLNSVMGEELQLKIDENARLHAKLDDIDKRHEEKCAGLQSRSD
jgi:hypothetical protein